MKTILAIDLGKSKSVFCKMDTIELKPRFFTLKTSPQKFHDVFAQLDQQNSIVLFEVGGQSGWLSDMLRLLDIEFKVTNVNHPSWKWSNNPNKSDKNDAHRLAVMYHSGNTDRSGRISKRGNPQLRMLLVQASWAALRFSWARDIYERVRRGSKKRKKTAIIAVARHMLMRCWAMLRDNKSWQYRIAAGTVNP